jgi:hypothetical protein
MRLHAIFRHLCTSDQTSIAGLDIAAKLLTIRIDRGTIIKQANVADKESKRQAALKAANANLEVEGDYQWIAFFLGDSIDLAIDAEIFVLTWRFHPRTPAPGVALITASISSLAFRTVGRCPEPFSTTRPSE